MENPFILGLISWFVPGAGHFLQRRWKRGAAIAAAVWMMFIIGVISGGAYYPGFPFKDGALLSLLNVFARFGNGLGALISYGVAAFPDPGVAARATFEYGGRFIEIAGLLNYLTAMDAADIAVGRKK